VMHLRPLGHATAGEVTGEGRGARNPPYAVAGAGERLAP
jgi:hypothetical protein